MEQFDLVVIGAGPGGYVAAIRAAQYGMRVALVEKGEVGGTCLNRGCIPTKTLMHAAGLYREMGMAAELGIEVAGLGYDVTRMYTRKNEVVQKLRDGIAFLLKANKVVIYEGEASIIKQGEVNVAGGEPCTLAAKNILVATGAAPVMPPIEGLKLPGVLTSDDLLGETGHDYKSMVIIGGGVIGVEFASLLSSLGCEVTLVEALERILPTMDREVSQNLAMILKKRGVTVCAGATVQRVEETAGGLCCHFTQKGEEKSVAAQAVLVAIGRTPSWQGLFPGDYRPAAERGIVVDEAFATSLPGVYAIGDVVQGGIQLAHVASAQGLNAVAYLAGRDADVDLTTIPACVYTDPEIASVGLTADEAKALDIPVLTGKFAMAGLGKSVIESAERGFIKLVFHAQSRVVLGAVLMCQRATDLVSELSTAVSNGLTVEQLAQVIRPHPTSAEGVSEAVEDTLGHAVHNAPRRKLGG